MYLKDLLKGVKYNIIGCSKETPIEEIVVNDICYDSRKCRPNTIFVALIGEDLDGHRFITEAYNKGTRVFLVSKDIDFDKEDIIKIKVKNTRKALSLISKNLFKNPSKKLKVIGITGTKGKTTVANYIWKTLLDSNKKAGIIGTNGVEYINIKEETVNTTPESYEIQRILNDMIKKGVKYVVMEVSSGALMTHRVDDVDIDIAVFTNISKDHVGPKEHPTFEHYIKSKLKLIDMANKIIINKDDVYFKNYVDFSNKKITTYSIKNISDNQAYDIDYTSNIDLLGVKFKLRKDLYKVSSPGIFSVYNALATILTLENLGIDKSYIKKSLRNIKVKGRSEVLYNNDGKVVILDYAHNKDSLDNIMKTLKLYKPSRLICLIGTVGGRSQIRRQEIAESVYNHSDITILTSDNPNFEDPIEIIKDIISFIPKDYYDNIIIEEDREKAIKKAINILREGDILLLAGKGHEEYQLIKGRKIPYSDKEIFLNNI